MSRVVSNSPPATPWQSLIAGTISGMAGIVVCHPFDVIRTRLQLDSNLSFSQSIQAGNLYSGIQTPFFAQGFYKAVIFATNASCINYIFDGKRSQKNILLSGCVAGSVNSLVVAPVEMIRTSRIMRAATLPTESMITTIKSLTHHRGLLSLWTAVLPTILRDGPGIGLYLLAFEQAKPFLSTFSLFHEKVVATKLLAGAFAGVVFWTWAIPIDTAKSIMEYRFQQGLGATAPSTSISSVLFRSFKSLPIAYLRGIPSAAVTLTTYDLVVARLMQ